LALKKVGEKDEEKDQLLRVSSLPGAEEISLLIWPNLLNFSQPAGGHHQISNYTTFTAIFRSIEWI